MAKAKSKQSLKKTLPKHTKKAAIKKAAIKHTVVKKTLVKAVKKPATGKASAKKPDRKVSVQKKNITAPTQTSVRLPSFVVPENYWLSFTPDFKKFTFEGEEVISIAISAETSEIRMHSKALKVTAASIQKEQINSSLTVDYDEAAEQLILSSAEPLAPGAYDLYLSFEGILNDRMRGFYRSQYLHNGVQQTIAVTQFEPTDARQAFPCFDEPALKATFDLELNIPATMEAISNTEIEEENRSKNGLKNVRFAPTPKMSTYLLAFIIGKFEYIEDLSEDGIVVRIFVTPGKKEQAVFALETAKSVLTFYNNYFKIKYPLPTLDMIAIPDFAAAAMENWGAVTYRESAILVDPQNTATVTKQWVAVVIAHELAHQWFGNLVTMEWWTHLWLNEGFASYISYVAVDELFPEWNMWSQFIYSDLGPALQLDALKNTHPIEVEVHHPNEINEIFDEVSYAKGASVLRMLAAYLGHNAFREGLRYYLKKHQYGNAGTEDLWSALEITSKKPVRKIMSAWTKQPGYPLVTVTEKNKKLTLTQKRFYSNPAERPKKDESTWPIPISLGDAKVRTTLLLQNKNNTSGKPSGSYTKLNVGETSVFRVKYDDQQIASFKLAIEKGLMPIADRLGILRDSTALAQGAEYSADQILSLLPSYVSEDVYSVWVEITSAVGTINHIFKKEPYFKDLKLRAKDLFTPIAEKLGFEAKPGESSGDILLRSLVLYRAGHYGNQEIIAEARKLFSELEKNKKEIPADIRGVVYNLVAENGGQTEYKALLKRYRAESLQEEKNRLARAMALIPSKAVLNQFMAFTIGSEVRPQDTPLILGAAWRNEIADDLIWKFITKNWSTILKRYGDGGHLLVRFIEPAASFITTAEAEMVKTFFKTHAVPGGERTVRQVIEEIQSNAAWNKRDKAKVQKFIKPSK